MIHRDNLADHRQILAGVEGHGHERHGHAEQLGFLAVEPGAVVLATRVPVLELHDHLYPLLLTHRAHAEQGVDIDQPHTPDLHVVAGHLVPAADEHVVAAPGDVHHVVRDEPMPTLDEIEHALALADPRASLIQEPHAEHVR